MYFIVFNFLMAHVGIHVYNHYCAGELTQQSIAQSETCCCGDIADDACCDDEITSLQLKDKFQAALLLSPISPVALLTFTSPIVPPTNATYGTKHIYAHYVSSPHIIHLPFVLRV